MITDIFVEGLRNKKGIEEIADAFTATPPSEEEATILEEPSLEEEELPSEKEVTTPEESPSEEGATTPTEIDGPDVP
ncbi:hypothetical protein ES708_28689 [subsurface metagenome]